MEAQEAHFNSYKELNIFKYQPSIFTCQHSIFTYQLNVFVNQLSIFTYQLSIIKYLLIIFTSTQFFHISTQYLHDKLNIFITHSHKGFYICLNIFDVFKKISQQVERFSGEFKIFFGEYRPSRNTLPPIECKHFKFHLIYIVLLLTDFVSIRLTRRCIRRYRTLFAFIQLFLQ